MVLWLALNIFVNRKSGCVDERMTGVLFVGVCVFPITYPGAGTYIHKRKPSQGSRK